MKHLKTFIHPEVTSKDISGNVLKQLSTRAIVLNGDQILLLYTKRYDDYSLPGGKLDPNEDIIVAIHLISYCYSCKIDPKLGDTNLESYEINNGMEVKWMSITEAIKYNKNTLKNSSKKGLSIEREIYLLELINLSNF